MISDEKYSLVIHDDAENEAVIANLILHACQM